MTLTNTPVVADSTPGKSRHPHRRGAGALLIAIAVVMTVLAAPAAAGAQPTAPLTANSRSQSIATTDNRAATGYWTPERMRDSVSRDLRSTGSIGAAGVQAVDRGAPVVVAPAASAATRFSVSKDLSAAKSSVSATTEGYWQGSNTANPNAQIGRLFFVQWDPATKTYRNYNCSATVINSENKSVVWTAGHCVYQTYANVWSSNYVFCPGFRNNSCPFGQWTPYSQTTTTQWQAAACSAAGPCTENDFLYDLGALRMNQLSGYRIANRVGGQGITFNGAASQYRYAFGYPLNKTQGLYLYYCAGTNTVAYGNLRLTPCSATGGASGGPWLTQPNGQWLGTVQSVNSHADGTFMAGPYFGSVAASMFASIRG